jgi:hypothetical protein
LFVVGCCWLSACCLPVVVGDSKIKSKNQFFFKSGFFCTNPDKKMKEKIKK